MSRPRLTPGHAAELRAAVQMAVGAATALLAATFLNLPHPYWSVISAIVVIQASSGGGVLNVARERALGTVCGAAVGAGVALIRPPGLTGMAVGVSLTAAVLALLATRRPWLKIAPVTAAIVIAGGAGPEGTASLAMDRVLEILVGSAAGVASILLLFPRHAHHAFRRTAREIAAETAHLLGEILHGDPLEAADILARHGRLKVRLTALEKAAEDVLDLPGPQREAADRAALVRAFWRVRSDIVIIGRAFQSASGLRPPIERLAPWTLAAQGAVETLTALSEGRATPPLDPPDEAVALAAAGSDPGPAAAAIGLNHLQRDLNDLSARFADLRLV